MQDNNINTIGDEIIEILERDAPNAEKALEFLKLIYREKSTEYGLGFDEAREIALRNF